MSFPKVSIVLVNWNNLDDTLECLESLTSVTYPNFEIVMVDNGSEGDDASVLEEKFGDWIRLIENDRNHGFAEGCNIGMRDAMKRGVDYVALLNNDTVVAPDFLDEIISVVESHERVGIAGGKIYCYEYPDVIWFGGGSINYWTGNTPIRGSGDKDNGQFEEITEVDWICGCFMLISTELLDSVGMLDNRFFFGWEDVDLSVRAAKEGFKILFVPGSKIWHKGFLVSKKERLVGMPMYYATRGMYLVVEKHFTRMQVISCMIYRFITFPKMMWIYYKLFRKWEMPVYMFWASIDHVIKKIARPFRIKTTDEKN